jgi:uncharacterized protein YndB with AHSA1/START domain
MTSEAHGGDRILGTVRPAGDGKGIVRMEDRFATGIDDLWAALTDPSRLARWISEVEGDLRPGGEFHARHIDGNWEGSGHVDACEAPRRLLLTMRDADPHPGQPAETVTEATLTPDGDHTILVVEERGLPLNLLAAYGAGVQIHIEHLSDHISGRQSGDAEARWGELIPAYQEMAANLG